MSSYAIWAILRTGACNNRRVKINVQTKKRSENI